MQDRMCPIRQESTILSGTADIIFFRWKCTTGAANTIQSQGYRKPVHRYLASDRVSVYTDRSGWKHYIEDFQWKEHRGDPDIFNMPKEFEEFHMGGEMLGKVIFVFIAVWILIQILVR